MGGLRRSSRVGAMPPFRWSWAGSPRRGYHLSQNKRVSLCGRLNWPVSRYRPGNICHGEPMADTPESRSVPGRGAGMARRLRVLGLAQPVPGGQRCSGLRLQLAFKRSANHSELRQSPRLSLQRRRYQLLPAIADRLRTRSGVHSTFGHGPNQVSPMPPERRLEGSRAICSSMSSPQCCMCLGGRGAGIFRSKWSNSDYYLLNIGVTRAICEAERDGSNSTSLQLRG